MAYGNTSVSSLLRAARAAQQKQYALEDSIAAYEYDLSPKNQADFEKYQAHLSNRIKQYQGTDPLKALNYQKTITSANRSFTSSELSRATTQVLYGNMDNGTKLNTMMNLYQRAVANGDENLAQRIEGQAAMLQQTMQRFGGGYGRGGRTGNTTDAGRGVKAQVDEIDSALKQLEYDFNNGVVDDGEYINKATKLMDAKNKTLSSAYTTDADGYARPSSGFSQEEANDFAKKRLALTDNQQFRSLIGSNPDTPLDIATARAQSLFQPEFDPFTGALTLGKKNLVGARNMLEFGTNTVAGISDLNPDNAKYSKLFKEAGYNNLNISGGAAKGIGWVDPLTGREKKSDFYINQQGDNRYAYTMDASGAKYMLRPDGRTVLLQDSAEAGRQYKALQDKMARGEINQNQFNEAVRNIDTAHIPDSLKNELQQNAQATSDGENWGLNGIARKLGSAAEDLFVDPAKSFYENNVAKLFTKNKENKMSNTVEKLAGQLGIRDWRGALGTISSDPFGSIMGFNKLQSRIGELTKQKQERDFQEAQIRAQEAQRLADAARAAQAAQTKSTPKYNFAQGTAGVAPFRIPDAVQKAANTVGTREFINKYGGDLYTKYLQVSHG